MNASLPRKTAWTALTAAAFLLGACVTSNEDPASTDPAFAGARIDAAVAGRSLADGFGQSKDWNVLPVMPAGAEALAGVSTVGALGKSTALAKRSDADLGVALHIDLSDTAAGYATVYAEYELLLVNVKDTAKVKWDDKARDSIEDNENILSFKRVQTSPGGKVETAVFTDGDGDGLVTPVPGRDSRAGLVITVSENGVMEKTTLLVGAGGDGDFDGEEDNTILEAAWVKTRNGVLIESSAFLDADGDGVITDNAKDCLVTLKHTAVEPEDRPLVRKAELEARVRVFAHKAGDEPVGFAYKETLKNGRINQVSLKNEAGGTDIVKGGRMTVRLETTSASGDDTLSRATVDIVMSLGQDLKNDSDDVCYEIHVATQKRLGLEREAEFHFISAQPIPHGEEPVAGTFSGKAVYANGKSASLSGEFSPDGFTAEYTGPDGETASVSYSKSGEVLAGK